jgi:hypothetical protein
MVELSFFQPFVIGKKYKIYPNNTSYDIEDTLCHRCNVKYRNIRFTGIVRYSRKKIYFTDGVFHGRDSNCICDGPPTNDVLYVIEHPYPSSDNLNPEEWQFLRYYLRSRDAKKIIPFLRNDGPSFSIK